MSALPPAFYRAEGDRLLPTALCIGPWSAELQHGGPPAALIARAVQAAAPASTRIARLTVDLLRPIPLVAVRVHVETLREGRQATWMIARLVDDDDRLLAHATAVLIRSAPVALPPAGTAPLPLPPSAADVEPFPFPFFPTDIAYHRAIQVRIVAGRWPVEPCAAWMNLTVPLVHGEPTTPVQALIALADACNGLAPAVLDPAVSFVNADLTVHLRREPQGQTFAFDARSLAHPSGMGLVQAALFDAEGELGRSAQSLVVAARR